jgi:hypothetical protein
MFELKKNLTFAPDKSGPVWFDGQQLQSTYFSFSIVSGVSSKQCTIQCSNPSLHNFLRFYSACSNHLARCLRGSVSQSCTQRLSPKAQI